MKLRSLRIDLKKYLVKHGLKKKFVKQAEIFVNNPRHPSLHTEILEPRKLKLYSLRIDKKYRAIFVINTDNEAEIVDINDHYK